MDTTPPADGNTPEDDATDGIAPNLGAADVDAAAPGGGVEVSSAEGSGGERWSSPSVAAAAQSLESVAGRPLGEHPDAFGSVHGELQRALADIDDA